MELVAPGEDFIHLIYDMFKLAIGEEEVITIEHKNEYHLVMFEIKRTEY